MVRAYGLFRRIHLVPVLVLTALFMLILSLVLRPVLPYYFLLAFIILAVMIMPHVISGTGSLFILTGFCWTSGFFKGLAAKVNPVLKKKHGSS
jgi:hypothetical protein